MTYYKIFVKDDILEMLVEYDGVMYSTKKAAKQKITEYEKTDKRIYYIISGRY